jgi:Spy/CpxP family protein refolding chaperone
MKKLSLIVAVALGALVACSVAMAQDAAPKKGKGSMSPEQQLEKMSTTLNLTDDQKPKVKALLEDTATKLKALAPEDRHTKGREILAEQKKALKGILTDEQFKKYEDTMANAKKGKKKKSE